MKFLLFFIVLISTNVFAEEYTSVEDNIKIMDTDKNGFADVFEVRAYLETKNGKHYQDDLFNSLESKVGGNSCGSVFSKSLFTH